MQKGQQFSVFKLLIGAVFALALMGITYGVVTGISDYQPGSDVLTVSGELLSSAYSATGTDVFFHRTATLQGQFFDTESLHAKSGVPLKATIEIHCNEAYCLTNGEPVSETKDCNYNGCVRACKDGAIELVPGAEVDLCAECVGSPPNVVCHLFIGSDNCGEYVP